VACSKRGAAEALVAAAPADEAAEAEEQARLKEIFLTT
jgi:hypothetical protein